MNFTLHTPDFQTAWKLNQPPKEPKKMKTKPIISLENPHGETPHETHYLTPAQVMTALPPIRSKPTAIHAVDRLRHALADPRNISCAYETLANFGELERTPNGYISADPKAIQGRCRRLIIQLLPFTI